MAFVHLALLAAASAPFFHVKGADSTRLPLEETRGDVAIAGVIARVRITQVYRNDGPRPIEATYVFPASTRAAVFAMRMKIGARTIEAKISPRQAAREAYERAKEAGKSASLLEGHRANIFEMNVANILPGEKIETVLDYTELLVPEEGVYSLVYPTVVGPRYQTAGDVPASQGSAGPPTYRFGLRAKISAGMPISDVRSPTHATITRTDTSGAYHLAVEDEKSGDRDFVLQYRLQGSQIESGLLLYPGTPESFFLLMLEPPSRITPSSIPPREYIFIVDISGSMNGFPLELSKKTMRTLIDGLRSEDRFNVLTFAGASSILAEESVYATADNTELAIRTLEEANGNGGTEIIAALKRALALPRTKEMSTTFIVLTDGYVDVEPEVFKLIRDNLGTANMFAFGIGSSVNRLLIEGMAHAGLGQPYIVLDDSEAEAQAARLLRDVSSPVLADVEVRFEGFRAYDVEPAHQPDLFASRPIVVFGKYRGAPNGQVRVTGLSGQGRFERVLEVGDYQPSDDHAALRWLWARDRIAQSSSAAEITRLGLKYSLLTEHTSFVAIDSAVRNDQGAPDKTQQLLPLPRGVQHCELGGGLGSYRPAPPAQSEAPQQIAATGYGSGGSGSGSFSLGGRSKGATRIVPGKTIIHGSLSKDEIGKVIRRNLARIKFCYEKELNRSPELGGKLVVRFTIGATGSVVFAELGESSVGDEVVEQCVLGVFRSLEFPPPRGAGIIEVNYPIILCGT